METIYVVAYDKWHGWLSHPETIWQKNYKNVDCAVEYATKLANHLDNDHYGELKEEIPERDMIHIWSWENQDIIYITEKTLYICDDIKDVDISEDIENIDNNNIEI
jgi:hypothetical protein